MLTTDPSEKKEKRIVIHGTNAKAFMEFLKYLYVHKANFEPLTEDVLLETLSVAHKYQVERLVSECHEYMAGSLKPDNVLGRLEVAKLYELGDLESKCWGFVDKFAALVIRDESFLDLTKVLPSCSFPESKQSSTRAAFLFQDRLEETLRRGGLSATELEIYDALSKWIGNKPDLGLDETEMEAFVFSLVHLNMMTIEALIDHVWNGRLVGHNVILELIKHINGYMKYDLNNCCGCFAHSHP